MQVEKRKNIGHPELVSGSIVKNKEDTVSAELVEARF